MKTNWPTKKLGDVLELKYGKGISRADRDPNGKYPVYGANGILGLSNKYLVEGEVVIVGRKGSAGEVIRVSGKFWPSDVTFYVLGNNRMDIGYAFHLLKSLNLQRLAAGVKPGINRNRVYEIEIPLPPLEVQKKIVAKLESVLAKISEAKKLRAEARENADNLLSAELHKIFEEGNLSACGHAQAGKKGWEEKALGDVATLVRGPFGGSLKKEIFVPSGFGVYEQGNVIKNNLTNFRYYITQEKYKAMSRFQVAEGDLLMSCSGTIGRFAVVPKKFVPGVINQALLKITPSENLDTYFLQNALYNYFALNQIHEKGMAIKNIAAVKELKKIKIALPPLTDQKKIVARLNKISQKVEAVKELQDQTENEFFTLENSVLSKAFIG